MRGFGFKPELLIGVPLAAIAGLVGYSMLKPAGLSTRFGGYDVFATGEGSLTRQSTGETASKFRMYPKITITPDVTGTFTVGWDWRNFIDADPAGYSEPQNKNVGGKNFSITNTLSLTAGQPSTVQLVDNRPGNTEEGSIAIGYDGFLYRNKVDGQWHVFKSEVYQLRVLSPTGAYADLTGVFQDNFKATGTLSASWSGWNVTKL